MLLHRHPWIHPQLSVGTVYPQRYSLSQDTGGGMLEFITGHFGLPSAILDKTGVTATGMLALGCLWIRLGLTAQGCTVSVMALCTQYLWRRVSTVRYGRHRHQMEYVTIIPAESNTTHVQELWAPRTVCKNHHSCKLSSRYMRMIYLPLLSFEGRIVCTSALPWAKYHYDVQPHHTEESLSLA